MESWGIDTHLMLFHYSPNCHCEGGTTEAISLSPTRRLPQSLQVYRLADSFAMTMRDMALEARVTDDEVLVHQRTSERARIDRAAISCSLGSVSS